MAQRADRQRPSELWRWTLNALQEQGLLVHSLGLSV